MAGLSRSLKTLAFACAAAAFGTAPASPVLAQASAPQCQGEALATGFGHACRIRAELPAITEHDYGVVRLHYTPPASLDDVIPERALNGTWLQALADRTIRQSVRSAVVLLEVRAVGPELPANPDETGQAMGLPIAVVPLALYEYDSSQALKFRQVQDYADRVIGRYMLLSREATIRARIKVAFSQSDPSSLMRTLAPIVNAAAGFGGHGFVVDVFASEALMADLSRIESTLRSASNVDAASDNWIDLAFSGANRLEYAFQLNPRPRRFGFGRNEEPRPQGRLTLTLERRPSLFTDDVLPGRSPGRRLPDYHTNGRLDSQATDRIWVDTRIRPGMNLQTFVAQNNFGEIVRVFQSAETPLPTFVEACRELRTRLGESGAGISRHDRTAIFWAGFVRGDSARNYEAQQADCIKRDRELWADYGFALPETTRPRRRVTPTERDDWIEAVAAPALSQADPGTRYNLSRRLFRDRVLASIAPNTLFDPGEEPPSNTLMDRDSLARAIKPLRVGCRFVRRDPETPADLPIFSVLGRASGSDRLMTITIEYASREGGGSSVEIVGLRIDKPSDGDWEALASTPGLRRGCMRENAAYAPLDPPQ